MDDDIFFDDSEVDHRQMELKLAENEQTRITRDMWNQGYLHGLEWAENNYALFDFAIDHESLLHNGNTADEQGA